MPSDVDEKLLEMSEAMFGEGSRLKLRYISLRDLREQNLNANAMPAEMFSQLQSNISKHGALESVPLVGRRSDSDTVEIISGHHRIRAAIGAGVDEALVLMYDGISESELRAKQLAHNSIAGQSNPQLIAEIYTLIESVGDQMEAYVDPRLLATLPKAAPFTQVDISPLANAKVINLVFLPTLAEDFTDAITLLSPDVDAVYVASRDAFDGFAAALRRAKGDLNVYSVPSAIAEMAKLAIEALNDRKVSHGPTEHIHSPEGRSVATPADDLPTAESGIVAASDSPATGSLPSDRKPGHQKAPTAVARSLNRKRRLADDPGPAAAG